MTPLAPVLADSEDYPPLSALNDLLFCPRRCFLHRVEGIWQDNVHTVAGELGHRRAHSPGNHEESPFRCARGLRLVSHRLKLVGIADVVEFHPSAAPSGEPNAQRDVPYPVEYKRGRRRKWNNDDAQLCAQALCLEEMLGVSVPRGAIFSIKSKRRREVDFTPQLRRLTEEAAQRLHQVLRSQSAPPPVLHPKCKECSVHGLCLPEILSAPSRIKAIISKLFKPEAV
jgi:CRISPR-associated exonuclease Cas4